MKKPTKKEMERRTFLGLLGGGAIAQSPLALLIQSVFDGLINEARAQGGSGARNYFAIAQYGAPPRWTFDLFLNPYDSPGYEQNPGIATRYTEEDGIYTGVEYATTKAKGLTVPWMWQFPVPAPDGNTRPMTDLLEHGLYLQGINTNNPDHSGAHVLHQVPAGSAQSMSGLSADSGSAPIPAVAYNDGYYVFSSISNKTFVNLPVQGNVLEALMKPFIAGGSPSFKEWKTLVRETVNVAIEAIEDMKKSNHQMAEGVTISRKGAEELLSGAVFDLAKEWDDTVAKYSALITASFTQTVEGINDKPIGVAPDQRTDEYRIWLEKVVRNADVRTIVSGESRSDGLSKIFALAEFAFGNQITNSLNANTNPIYYLNAEVGNGKTWTYVPPDEHYVGKMISTMLNTLSYRSLASCLLEFVAQLKTRDLWKDMVIDLSGEFNRTPKGDGSGSDHGWSGKSMALYSGAFKGPLVVGNIANYPSNSRYPGTWGHGGPVKELGKALHLDSMASTIAYCVGVPSPVTSASTVVVIDQNGQLKPIIEKSKIV